MIKCIVCTKDGVKNRKVVESERSMKVEMVVSLHKLTCLTQKMGSTVFCLLACLLARLLFETLHMVIIVVLIFTSLP